MSGCFCGAGGCLRSGIIDEAAPLCCCGVHARCAQGSFCRAGPERAIGSCAMQRARTSAATGRRPVLPRTSAATLSLMGSTGLRPVVAHIPRVTPHFEDASRCSPASELRCSMFDVGRSMFSPIS
jgi:hypothetical protein